MRTRVLSRPSAVALAVALVTTGTVAIGTPVAPAPAPDRIAASVPAAGTRPDIPLGAPWDVWTTSDGSGRITVRWRPPVGLALDDLEGFRLEVQQSGSAMWLVALDEIAGTRRSQLVRGLPNGVPLRFRVSAYFGGGIGEASLPSEWVAANPLLREGREGRRVRALQDALIMRGSSIERDGVFGPSTRAAVVAWQQSMLLPATGVVDPATRATLGIGSNRRGWPGSKATVISRLRAYLDGRSPARALPADARLALRPFVYGDPADAEVLAWRVLEVTPVGDWASRISLTGLDDGGDGPVVVLEVCMTRNRVSRWCGVLGAGADA